MRVGLNGTQFSLVMAVVRWTYGYGETDAPISLRKFRRMTGRDISNIRRELRELQQRGIVLQVTQPAFSKPARWKVHSDFEQEEVAKSPTVGEQTTGGGKAHTQWANSPTPTVGEIATPLKKEETETLKEKRQASVKADTRVVPLRDFFFEKYKEVRGKELVADG